MKKELRVIRLPPEMYTGELFKRGLSLNVGYLTRELKKLGVKHTIITPKTNTKDFEGSPVIELPERRRFTLFRQGKDAYLAIKERFPKNDFDIIHTHSAGFFRLYAFKKKLNKPMIHSLHGNPVDIIRQPVRSLRQLKDMIYAYLFNRYIAKRADAIIAMSHYYKRDAVKYLGISSAKVHVIPPQVDTSIFKPIKIKKDIDLLYTGRFVVLKHVPFIVKVVKVLKETMPNIKVVLAGGVPEDTLYEEVLRLVKEYKLEKNITILPPVEHTELVKLYNRAKVFIFIALAEGVGKSLIESMACGIPFVTNMAPGEGEASFTNEEGFASIPITEQAFAEKIKVLLNDEKFREKCGRNAIKKVEKFYTSKITARKTKAIYEDLVKRASR